MLADPGVTEILGHRVTEVEQALALRQFPKISLIFWYYNAGVDTHRLANATNATSLSSYKIKMWGKNPLKREKLRG
jgi:hypothetical protein